MSKAIAFSESQMAKRVPLAEQVPLDKPFTIRICVAGVCNLKCQFCAESVPTFREILHKKGANGMMDFDLFQKLMNDVKKDFGKVKQVMFSGSGETLLNPQIVDMVDYAMKLRVADRVEVVTNGVLLSPKLCDELTNTGLNILRISVNGLSDVDYQKHCSQKVDFQRYIENIRYLYSHKKETSIYIKILNYMVDTPDKKNFFLQTFKPICDVINIENLMPIVDTIDYREMVSDESILRKTKYGDILSHTEVCPIPFYTLQIDEDGSVLPCCADHALIYPESLSFGNVKFSSVGELWVKNCAIFQRAMLDGAQRIPACRNCTNMLHQVYPEDVLDDAAEQLKVEYDAKLSGECL